MNAKKCKLKNKTKQRNGALISNMNACHESKLHEL